MRVWFAGDVPSDGYGGVLRSMTELARGLADRGHQTRVLARPAIRPMSWLGFALMVARELVRARHAPPDWIVARSTDGVCVPLVSWMLRLPTRLAMHSHGWEELAAEVEQTVPRDEIASPTTVRARLLRFPLLRLTLRTCRCCLTGVIHETRELGRRYPRARRKLAYLPNGVSVPPRAVHVQAATAEPAFLATGGPTWKKNLGHAAAIMRKVAERLPEARLRIAGPVANARAIDGDDLVAAGTLELLGEMEFDAMTGLYQTHPFLLCSSRYEGGHSLAVLEAMAHGVIVFVSDIPSNREFVIHGRNGFLLTGDDVARDGAFIVETLGAPERLGEIRAAAHATARRNRWERRVDRLERCLCRR